MVVLICYHSKHKVLGQYLDALELLRSSVLFVCILSLLTVDITVIFERMSAE